MHLLPKSMKLKNYSQSPDSNMKPETLAETIEPGPLCITDLFQNKSVAYF